MTFADFVANLKAKAAAALAALENFNTAHPDVASVEADALKAGVTDLASAASAEVEKEPVPSIDAVLDTAIAAAHAEADDQIAAVTTARDTKVAALESAKTGA